MPQLKDLPAGFFVCSSAPTKIWFKAKTLFSDAFNCILLRKSGLKDEFCLFGNEPIYYHIPFDRIQQLAQEIISEYVPLSDLRPTISKDALYQAISDSTPPPTVAFKKYEYNPDYAVHPSRTVRELILAYPWRLSRERGELVNVILYLAAGNDGVITDDLADFFSKRFPIKKQLLLNLQAGYDADMAGQTGMYVIPDSTIAALEESIAACDRIAKEASDGEE